MFQFGDFETEELNGEEVAEEPQVEVMFGDFSLEEEKIVETIENENGELNGTSDAGISVNEPTSTSPHPALAAEEACQLALQLLGREDAAAGAGAGAAAAAAAAARMPRGLLNTGNGCFRSVVLQSLLAHAPLVRVLTAAGPALRRAPELCPTWAQLADLAREFEMPSLAEQQQRRGRGRGGGGGGGGGGGPRPVNPADHLAHLLHAFRTHALTTQEDAQEFLDYLLDRLHEEAAALAPAAAAAAAAPAAAGGASAPREEDEEEGWCEVGKGQKTSTVTNPDILKDQVETMISKYFRGTLRSELHKEGSGGHISATFQPFQCLQLHIDDQRVSKVEEALANFFCEEHIDGLKNEKNNLNIKARRSYKLQLLPKVLVLHLKRFCFDPVRGQPVKLSQRITFPAQLRIPTSVMSHTLKSQSSNGAGPTYIYSLFSAVFHHGQHITSGHYTNFCRDDVGTWRYFDDQKVYDASIQDVLRFKDGSCYLLFYAIDGARSC